MTQQDDITQRLRDNADLDEAEHGNARVVQLERDAADEIERLRAELSQVRAPVADERAALARLEAACDTLCRLRTQKQYLSMVDSGQQDALLELDGARAQARAALASAPVAGEQFKAAFPNGVLTAARFHELWESAGHNPNPDRTLLENLAWQVGKFAGLVAKEASTPVADERAAVQRHVDLVKAYGDQLYCKASASSPVDKKSWSKSAERVLSNIAESYRAALASAPVAEPKHALVDDGICWSSKEIQRRQKEEDDARAAYYHSRASTPVAGEAQSEVTKLADELGDLASDMAYEANQEMDQDKAGRAAVIERGERALRRFADAAPQASAEDEWKAAIRKFMETAIPALAAIANVHTSDEIDALDAMPREPVIDQVRRLSHACEELSRQVRHERPKEDEYGGQQRAGDAFPDYMHDLRYHDQFRIGWNRCVDAYRAALSATQAEQGERDA